MEIFRMFSLEDDLMNTSQKTTSEMSSLDQILNETDIGQFIGKYKILLSILFGVIIVGVIAQAIYSNMSDKKMNEMNGVVHAFQSGPMKSFMDKKSDQKTVLEKYNQMMSDVQGYAGAGLVTLELAKEIQTRGDSATALSILEKANAQFNNPYVKFFITSNLAASYENSGNWEQARVQYEELLNSPVKVYEEKTYLDLGRVYLKLNNTEKAKASFQYVLDKGKEAELKKLAGLYLENL
jgi:tetratricopeptide (TPR) repeat protein